MKLRKPSDVHELDVTKHAVKLLIELADNIESGAAELKSAHRCWNDDDLPLQSMIVVFEKDPTSKL